MAQKSLIELEQLKHSRTYDDTKVMGPASESGVTLSDDLDYVLSQLKVLTGETNWYTAPDASLAELSAYSGVLAGRLDTAETDIDELQAYSGVLHGLISANEADITELQAYSGVLHGLIMNNETDIAALQAYSGVLHNMISANELDISQINSFIGRADGESNPVYSSTNYVTQSGSLEQAIGELDAALYAVSGLIVAADDDWQDVYDASNGILEVGAGGTPKADADIRIADSGVWAFTDASGVTNIMEVYNDHVLIRSMGERVYEELASVRAANTTFSIPGSKSYTLDAAGRNLRVYRNGQLLLPGAGNDYIEVSTTQIQNLHLWRPGEVIQYVITG